MCIRTIAPLLGLALLFAPSEAPGREVLGFGSDVGEVAAEISWLGEVNEGPDIRALDDGKDLADLSEKSVRDLLNRLSPRIGFADPEFPESLLPTRVAEDENLAALAVDRGGYVNSQTTAINRVKLKEVLAYVVSDDFGQKADVFALTSGRLSGTFITIDLGDQFGVRQVQFYPRNTVNPNPRAPFQGSFLRNFELKLNDGVNNMSEAGNPLWGGDPFFSVTDNPDTVTVIDIDPPRFVRFIRLIARSDIPFEIEKLKVFGQGFFASARYVSPVIDLTDPTAWGRLRLEQEVVGDPSVGLVEIRTRFGNDDTPDVYSWVPAGVTGAEEIPTHPEDSSIPLSRGEYEKLNTESSVAGTPLQGSVKPDLENWSLWSPPYRIREAISQAGTPIQSAGPRRYFQIRVDFATEDLNSSFVVDKLFMDFTRPSLADSLVGEVFPRDVRPGEGVQFTYAARAEMSPGAPGFDAFQLSTAGRVERVERLEIVDEDGEKEIDHTFTGDETEEDPVAITSFAEQGFTLRFPRREESGTLLVHFTARVLSYSTPFSGQALLLAEDGFQNATDGDADILDEEEDLAFESGTTVLSSAARTADLVGKIELGTEVITPNGDQTNDRLDMEFEVLSVVGSAKITVDIFDLAGRRVRRLFEGEGENGVFSSSRIAELAWDGSDGETGVVPPGIYLLHVEVDGDARSAATVRPVAVVY